ncbi:MAG: hypothetical protein ABL998_03100 [Planctomycetota bacterium]
MPLVALLLLLQETTAESRPLAIPPGPPIELDGKLGEAEWQGALRQELTGGGELFLRHDGKLVYLGLRGPKPGWTHVYLGGEDEVRVLHASAALGTATYQKDDLGAWQPTRAFPARDAWKLRSAELTPQMKVAREEHLIAERWVASNTSMGARECEFVLDRRLFSPSTRLALAYVSNPTAPSYWPARLADDCRKRELVTGTTPPDLAFAPETWERLEFTPAAAVPPK